MDVNFNINVGQGFGAIRFGMTQNEVEAQLGPAAEVDSIEDIDGSSVAVLRYSSPQVTFFFKGGEGLSSIDVEDACSMLFGEPVFSLDKDQIASVVRRQGYSELEEDEEAWGEAWLGVPAAGLDFYFDSGVLTSVSVSL